MQVALSFLLPRRNKETRRNPPRAFTESSALNSSLHKVVLPLSSFHLLPSSSSPAHQGCASFLWANAILR